MKLIIHLSLNFYKRKEAKESQKFVMCEPIEERYIFGKSKYSVALSNITLGTMYQGKVWKKNNNNNFTISIDCNSEIIFLADSDYCTLQLLMSNLVDGNEQNNLWRRENMKFISFGKFTSSSFYSSSILWYEQITNEIFAMLMLMLI